MTQHVMTGWDVLNNLITTVPQILTAIGLLFTAWAGVKTLQVARKGLKQGEENHLSTNSRMDELLEAKATSSHAVGKAEGVAEGRAASISEKNERDDRAVSQPPQPVNIVGPAPLPVTVQGPEDRLGEIRGTA